MTEEHTHISDEMWKKYAQGTLSTKEEEKLYTHVGCCTYCAERFANIVETVWRTGIVSVGHVDIR
mgnify:FL=1